VQDEIHHHPERGAARIIISGDFVMMRAAIRALVESDDAITVVGECESRPEAWAEALRAKPDLILLDLDLTTHCDEVMERVGALLRAANDTPVLILTATDECHVVQFALENGAIGVVLKDRSPEHLRRAIRAGLAGEMCVEFSTMAAVLQARSEPKPETRLDPKSLTPREREVISMLSLGLKNRGIADRLFISETTVRHHLTSIFDKLAVSSRLELMRQIFDDLRGEAVPAMVPR
jgi:DNA-binding NarL/FixJ family response regulator